MNNIYVRLIGIWSIRRRQPSELRHQLRVTIVCKLFAYLNIVLLVGLVVILCNADDYLFI